MLTAQTISDKWVAIILTNREKQKNTKQEKKCFKISTSGNLVVYRWLSCMYISRSLFTSENFECVHYAFKQSLWMKFRVEIKIRNRRGRRRRRTWSKDFRSVIYFAIDKFAGNFCVGSCAVERLLEGRAFNWLDCIQRVELIKYEIALISEVSSFVVVASKTIVQLVERVTEIKWMRRGQKKNCLWKPVITPKQHWHQGWLLKLYLYKKIFKI